MEPQGRFTLSRSQRCSTRLLPFLANEVERSSSNGSSHVISRRSVLVLASSLGVNLSGCGLLLYPERRGQPLGRLDWTVVALDTVGLCFFFVPGLIAFAVDFATGTIFLPGGEVAANISSHPALVKRSIPIEQLSLQTIEGVVSDYAQQPIRLEDGRYEMHTLTDIEDFWPKHDQLLRAQS